MVKMPIWIKPPKRSETDGKTVKKQKVDKLLKKTLDKPIKMVYNVRKDVREVQDLFSNYIYRPENVYIGGKDGRHLHIASYLLNETDQILELCKTNNLPYPTLAGGAVRDFVYNCIPKDYDYFFNCKTEEEAYELIDQLTLSLPDFEEGGAAHTYGEDPDTFEGVYAVYNVNGEYGPRQFIVGIWGEDKPIYERFDLSICKIMMDIETKDIHLSDDFVESMVNNKIKNYRPDSSYSKTRKANLERKLQLNNFAKRSPSTYYDLIFKNATPKKVVWRPLPVAELPEF